MSDTVPSDPSDLNQRAAPASTATAKQVRTDDHNTDDDHADGHNGLAPIIDLATESFLKRLQRPAQIVF
jgi:hypothetical protein